MPVKIGFHCNDLHSITNKPPKPPLVKIEAARVAYTDNDMGVVVLKPLIDRLAISFYVDAKFFETLNAPFSLEEYDEAIRAALFPDAKFKENHLSLLEGVNLHKSPYKDYKLNLTFCPPGCTLPILVQIGPEKNAWPFMRVDMNPSQMSNAAVEAFRDFIVDTLILPGINVNYGTFLSASRISEMHIAVDTLGIRPDDLVAIYMKDGKPDPQPNHLYQSSTGRVETIYPKGASGKSSSEYLYDKRQQQLQDGKPPKFGHFLHTRAEFRIFDTTFDKLDNLKDRFARIRVTGLIQQRFNQLSAQQRLFVRYAMSRDLDHALDEIEPIERPSYAITYSEVTRVFWKAKKLWSFWTETIEKSERLLRA